MQISLGAFISMTVFFRTKLRQNSVPDGTEYLGALFYAIASIMFNGFGDLAILISRLPVIIKQRDLLFYPAWSYSLATIVLNIPITLVQSVVWVSMTYYVTGYAPEASRFFKQMLLLFLVGQMSGSMFRMIGALCRTTVLANTIGFLAILICFMLGGFVIPKPNIKKWWIWGYWISPLTYAQQAIGVNEMLAPRWQKVVALSKLPQNPHLKHKTHCCFIIMRSHVQDPCRLMCCCHHLYASTLCCH
jgi:ABC-type multidrug transport system permease subunit